MTTDPLKCGPVVLREMRKLPALTDVNSDQQNNGLQVWLDYDRPTAAPLGLTPQSIDNTLYDAFGQRQVSTMFTPLNQYHVVLEVAPPFWQRPETLADVYVRAPAGAPVPLSAFTRYEPTSTVL